MDIDAHCAKLRNASPGEVRQNLIADLTCPIDWNTTGTVDMTPIFLRKWFYTVADALPNGETDAGVLVGPNLECLPAPSEESIDGLYLDDDDALALACNTARVNVYCRTEYKATCQKFVGLKAQPRQDRKKHYPVGAITIADICALSMKKSTVGYLLPNLHSVAQLNFFWAALALYFETRCAAYLDEHRWLSERAVFDAIWNELLARDHFRFSVDAMTTVGFFAGEEVSWLIYDTSFHGKVTHCYPAPGPVTESFQTSADNLQGLAEAFVEGRKDWP